MVILNDSLVLVKNNNAVTTSKIVAYNFHKQARHVNRKIRKYEKDLSNFGHMFYSGYTYDKYNRKQPTWFMNRNGFFVLAGGFTGKKALKLRVKFIHAFDKMEKRLKNPFSNQIPKTLPSALRAYAGALDVTHKQQKQIKQMAPDAKLGHQLRSLKQISVLAHFQRY